MFGGVSPSGHQYAGHFSTQPGRFVVNQFVGDVKRGQVAGGFITAIQQCGEVLIAHFPVAANDKNELPDHLIQL